MKYAHLADLHLGSWRDQKMRDLSTQAFLKAIEQCEQQKVDFILFSGDLFNTSLPSLDTLKIVAKSLKELQEKNIPLYAIAGSHDFSPSGKTMLDVLENAGLLINVCKGGVDEQGNLQLKFTTDIRTGAKITGMLGKKGLLDKVYYQNLSLQNLEQEIGYKIFLFHTTLSELKPKHLEKMESQPLSFLPKGFNYYAGGHVHHPSRVDIEGYGTLTYPGALFPNNFSELEQYGKGGFYLINTNSSPQSIEWVPLEIVPTIIFNLNCNHRSPIQVQKELENFFRDKEVNNCLITIRLSGELENGHPTDIDFKILLEALYQKGAYFVMKNASQLEVQEYEEINLIEGGENVEEQLIQEHLQQIKLFDREIELDLTRHLINSLNTSKKEGETVADFQKRVESEMNKLIPLGE